MRSINLSRRQALATTLLLVVATASSGQAALRLSNLGEIPADPHWYYAAFGFSFLLATAAGWIAGPDESPTRETLPGGASPPTLKRRLAFAILAAGLFCWVLVLQGRDQAPAYVLPVWALSLLFTVLAFPPRLAAPRSAGSQEPVGPWGRDALLAILLLATVARLAWLDSLPGAFGGDEANQTVDGREWVQGTNRHNTFGTGWYNSMRIGMIPAGISTLVSSSHVAGPRFPYAVAGTLSVVAAAAAAYALCGFWGGLFCAALLAFAPHHVHFSRIASHMILDSLFAALVILLMALVRRSGSLRLAALGGVVAGLALYGYSGGRVIALSFLLAIPFLLHACKPPVSRWLLAAALLSGFAVAAVPNLRFAVQDYGEWNGRFADVSLFAPERWANEVAARGSPAAVLERQMNLTALGLFSVRSTTAWFTHRPVISPFLLPGLALVGAGWLVGRRRYLETFLLVSIIAGNIAGVAFTDGTPASQRASCIVPPLAILAGVAAAALLTRLPEREGSRLPWRAAVGITAAAAILAGTVQESPLAGKDDVEYAAYQAGFARAIDRFLAGRPGEEAVYLYSRPHLDSNVAPLPYFLEGRSVVDVEPPSGPYLAPETLRPGVHFFTEDWREKIVEWPARNPDIQEQSLPHPADASKRVATVLIVSRETRFAANPGRP